MFRPNLKPFEIFLYNLLYNSNSNKGKGLRDLQVALILHPNPTQMLGSPWRAPYWLEKLLVDSRYSWRGHPGHGYSLTISLKLLQDRQ
jgi:hypothetical protein